MPKPPNIQNLLAQAQKMQEEMMAAQERLKDEKVEASAGGGMVKVVMSGDLELKSLTIDPDAVDPEDVEMLQDLVSAAVNEALRGAMELQSRAAGAGTGGFDPQQGAGEVEHASLDGHDRHHPRPGFAGTPEPGAGRVTVRRRRTRASRPPSARPTRRTPHRTGRRPRR